MIETFPLRLLQSNSRADPVILTDGRAFLECGCSGYAGFRVDRLERVTLLRSCSRKHDPLMSLVNHALNDSAPTDRTLAIVDELLVAAERRTL